MKWCWFWVLLALWLKVAKGGEGDCYFAEYPVTRSCSLFMDDPGNGYHRMGMEVKFQGPLTVVSNYAVLNPCDLCCIRLRDYTDFNTFRWNGLTYPDGIKKWIASSWWFIEKNSGYRVTFMNNIDAFDLETTISGFKVYSRMFSLSNDWQVVYRPSLDMDVVDVRLRVTANTLFGGGTFYTYTKASNTWYPDQVETCSPVNSATPPIILAYSIVQANAPYRSFLFTASRPVNLCPNAPSLYQAFRLNDYSSPVPIQPLVYGSRFSHRSWSIATGSQTVVRPNDADLATTLVAKADSVFTSYQSTYDIFDTVATAGWGRPIPTSIRLELFAGMFCDANGKALKIGFDRRGSSFGVGNDGCTTNNPTGLSCPYSRQGYASAADYGSFSSSFGLFDSNGEFKGICFDSPVPVSTRYTPNILTSVGMVPNANMACVVPGDPAVASRYAADSDTITLNSYPLYPMTDSASQIFLTVIQPQENNGVVFGGNTFTFGGVRSSGFLPILLTRARLSIKRISPTQPWQFAVTVTSSTMFLYSPLTNANDVFDVYSANSPGAKIVVQCPSCVDPLLVTTTSRDLIMTTGPLTAFATSVCVSIKSLRLSARQYALGAKVCTNPSQDISGTILLDRTATARSSMVSYTMVFINQGQLVGAYLDPNKFSIRCPSPYLSSPTQIPVSWAVLGNNLLRATLDTPCPSDTVTFSHLGGGNLFSSGSEVYVTVESATVSSAQQFSYASSALMRLDGVVFLQYAKPIALLNPDFQLIYVSCPGGNPDVTVSGTLLGTNVVKIRTAPCSSSASGLITVYQNSVGIKFTDGTYSGYQELVAIKAKMPSITVAQVIVDRLLIELDSPTWELTADSILYNCTAVIVNGTVTRISSTTLVAVNPVETYNQTCTVSFTLALNFSEYVTLTSDPVFPRATQQVAPLEAHYYPNTSVSTLFVYAPVSGPSNITSVNASLFVFRCDGVRATLNLTSFSAETSWFRFNVTGCPSNAASHTIQLLQDAIQTIDGNILVLSNFTLNVHLQRNVAVTSQTCITDSTRVSTYSFEISGEWTVTSIFDLNSCARREVGISATAMTFPVTGSNYTLCVSDVNFMTPGPLYWSLRLHYGSCVQWPRRDGLVFRYLFAGNLDTTKSLAEVQAISSVNDDGFFGLGPMDWMTDAVRYRANGIGIELYNYNINIKQGGIRVFNALSRGNMNQFAFKTETSRTGTYTFAIWMRFRRDLDKFPSTPIPVPEAFLYKGYAQMPPTQGALQMMAVVNNPYVPNSIGFSMRDVHPYGASDYYCRQNEFNSRGNAGFQVRGFSGAQDQANGPRYRDNLNFNWIGARVLPSITYSPDIDYPQTCGCSSLTDVGADSFATVTRADSSYYAIQPWVGKPLGGVYRANGSDPKAATPVMLAVVSFEADSDFVMKRADVFYYTKEGKERVLPTGYLNLFGFNLANCTLPSDICFPFSTERNGEKFRRPACFVGDDSYSKDSRLSLFTSPNWPGQPLAFGEIYLVEMYNRTFNETDIDAMWAAGLPNSPPYSSVSEIVMLEGSTIDIFTALQPKDFDVDELGANQTITFELASIDWTTSYGRLDQNGTNSLQFTAPACTFAQTYARVNYRLSDGVSVSRLLTTPIRVVHVNNPPLATNASSKVILFANTTVSLAAQDCDAALAGDSVVAVYLLAPPTSGLIYAPGSSTPITSFPARISGNQFSYYPNTTASPTNQQDVVDVSLIPFVVTDSKGLNSTNVTWLQLNVSNNVQPGQPAQVAVVEDVRTTLSLFPVTCSDSLGSPMIYYVFSLPPNGTLYSNGSLLTSANLPLEVTSDTMLAYQGCQDCYGPDAYEFVCQSTTTGLQSPRGSQSFFVSKVNDPPKIVAPSYPLLGYTFAPIAESLRFDVNISDVDSDEEIIKFDASVKRGAGFILSEDFRAAFVQYQLVYPEQVVITRGGMGSVDPDIRLSFQLLRSMLSFGILNNVTVVCGSTGENELTVTVSDEASATTQKIPFECLDGTSIYATPVNTQTPLGLAVMAGWILVLVMIVGCCFYCLCWPMCLRPMLIKRVRLARKAVGFTEGQTSLKSLFMDEPTLARHREDGTEMEPLLSEES